MLPNAWNQPTDHLLWLPLQHSHFSPFFPSLSLFLLSLYSVSLASHPGDVSCYYGPSQIGNGKQRWWENFVSSFMYGASPIPKTYCDTHALGLPLLTCVFDCELLRILLLLSVWNQNRELSSEGHKKSRGESELKKCLGSDTDELLLKSESPPPLPLSLPPSLHSLSFPRPYCLHCPIL